MLPSGWDPTAAARSTRLLQLPLSTSLELSLPLVPHCVSASAAAIALCTRKPKVLSPPRQGGHVDGSLEPRLAALQRRHLHHAVRPARRNVATVRHQTTDQEPFTALFAHCSRDHPDRPPNRSRLIWLWVYQYARPPPVGQRQTDDINTRSDAALHDAASDLHNPLGFTTRDATSARRPWRP